MAHNRRSTSERSILQTLKGLAAQSVACALATRVVIAHQANGSGCELTVYAYSFVPMWRTLQTAVAAGQRPPLFSCFVTHRKAPFIAQLYRSLVASRSIVTKPRISPAEIRAWLLSAELGIPRLWWARCAMEYATTAAAQDDSKIVSARTASFFT
jgi:hypothetical protein